MAPAVIQQAAVLLRRSSPASHLLQAREDAPAPPSGKGVLDPHDINNVGFFVLFALIGLGFVIAGIWFFFWAKNGGFHFKDTDWEDYKTTVLRRRGPNGTLLSGATPVTDLGGGSVYKDVADDDGKTTITDSTGLSGITAGASDIAARERREEKRERRRREKDDRRRKEGTTRHVGEEGVTDEFAEKKAQAELRSYRHERAARVGGLNKEADGSEWDRSTNPTNSTVDSELLSHRQRTPTTTPTKKGGIRKVYSTTERETERIRTEAKRTREERSSRRDFSFQRAGAGDSLLEEESMVDGKDADSGTKSYHHPRPELRGVNGGSSPRDRGQRDKEREERRARRGGYRRGHDDDDL
ncbi:hypothetical protein VHEMI02532 [[Torrubiella] hemipterigena]|uniref:Endosomal spry domain-containing protein n=1 Tax=[Torrubiella] hemipterigena TaxID=1531966 RepID=A0A0A1T8F8_9HYPO|nr:hypothetical protein VHEMI02532 [[Torrubiella] hemipterigena]